MSNIDPIDRNRLLTELKAEAFTTYEEEVQMLYLGTTLSTINTQPSLAGPIKDKENYMSEPCEPIDTWEEYRTMIHNREVMGLSIPRDHIDELEFAWTIIANAYHGDWNSYAPTDWREAAEKWRDRYHEILKETFGNRKEENEYRTV